MRFVAVLMLGLLLGCETVSRQAFIEQNYGKQRLIEAGEEALGKNDTDRAEVLQQAEEKLNEECESLQIAGARRFSKKELSTWEKLLVVLWTDRCHIQIQETRTQFFNPS